MIRLLVEGQSISGLQETARTLLGMIWDALQLIDVNKPECTSLTERCASTLLSVRQELADFSGDVEKAFHAPLTKLVSTFVLVHSYLQVHCQHQPLRRHLPREEDRRALWACNKALDDALGMFDHSVRLRTLKLMLSAEEQRRRDTEDEIQWMLKPFPGTTLLTGLNTAQSSTASDQILTPPATDPSASPSGDPQEATELVDSPTEEKWSALEGLVAQAIQRRDTGATITLRRVPSQREFKVLVEQSGDETVKAAIELLDEFLDSLDEDDSYRRRLSFGILRSLCVKHNTHPTSFILPSSSVCRLSDHPEALGGSAQVWKGQYEGRTVGIKVFPVASRDAMDSAILKSFCKEAVVWKYLRHPNITPFYGVNTTLFPLCFVCEWMTRGTITVYLKQSPGANRIKLLTDVAEGLAYLHDMGVLHGDLKGANILVNDARDACISDFGLAAISHDSQMNFLTESSVAAGSTRWMPPEILDPEKFGLDKSYLSKQSDMYSFSMVMWEVFTGLAPFHQFLRDPTVINKIMSGARPQRPSRATALGLCDALWSLMVQCWSERWQDRPTIATVLDQFHCQLSEAYEAPQKWPLITD
ncbi:kinase-like protein [Obba rivulosa]|uniref:Kinase-like protein n=1 Tax=Obba rivulosa TaxID=1052685 RepID=A0A8E2AS61_9APHY|nr:kinase-like protein [Obba rivulosa]